MIVDFHSHTLESDGTLEPAALVAAMRLRGVSIFSITDHDTIAAYEALERDGSAGGGQPRSIVGIEINTTHAGNEVHILGYGLPLGPSELTAVLEQHRRERRERVRRMIDRLNRLGYEITFEQVEAEANGGSSLGRPHIAKALVRHGYVSDVQTVFRSLLGSGAPAYVPSQHITPQEAIALIHRVGGVSVLAHPGRLKNYRLIDELAEHGILGLEVFYPTHQPAQVAHFRELAQRYGLVMTGGSDFHDARWNTGGVGMEVDPDDIAPFLDLVA